MPHLLVYAGAPAAGAFDPKGAVAHEPDPRGVKLPPPALLHGRAEKLRVALSTSSQISNTLVSRVILNTS